ncbi:ELMO domain-containing protein 2 [Contarinia nasturtii]|uniref:ELMO domain-containing protein 2 n=1 Tax=Contarinia nasturtii TaxID=265458 RepID=UPI0012D3C543|nr:ELMO domain-containing protein 2 [Contarinia nasturtii]XP_031626311.1 ELMO domain-containing protein 2 [Contarinia nasturtii]
MLAIFSFLYAYARPFIKWFLRHFTRLCELQRICYGFESGAPRKKSIEQSLELSRQKKIKDVIDRLNKSIESDVIAEEFYDQHIPHAVSIILKVKKIKPKIHPDFGPNLEVCIKSIWSYRRLLYDIEDIRATPFDNAHHEEKLLKLWRLLMPTEPLESRITKQWQNIGFQGDDPATDFRGMGLLGLENLLYFAEEYTMAARHVLSHSFHPIHGYTFAIVGINLTSMAFSLVQDGPAKTHLYNLKTNQLSVKHFHRLYCYLFYEFDKFWVECKPTSLMDFSNIYARFLDDILQQLGDDRTVFNLKQVFNI